MRDLSWRPSNSAIRNRQKYVALPAQAHYERLPEGIRAEIPLKRVWTLVPDEDAT
jgi:hypothetical protein